MKEKNLVAVGVERLGGVTKTANKVGVSSQAVYYWMRQKKISTTAHAIKFAKLAGIPLEDVA